MVLYIPYYINTFMHSFPQNFIVLTPLFESFIYVAYDTTLLISLYMPSKNCTLDFCFQFDTLHPLI